MQNYYTSVRCPYWQKYTFESELAGQEFLELLKDHFDVDINLVILDEENFDWTVRVNLSSIDPEKVDTVMQLQSWQRVDSLWSGAGADENYSLRA